MPKADKLPDPIKPLVRRNAVEIRNSQFRRDAEALAARMREALGDKELGDKALGEKAASPVWWRFELRAWRRKLVAAAALAVLLMVSWGGYVYVRQQPENSTEDVTKAQQQYSDEDIRRTLEQIAASIAEPAETAKKLRANGKIYFDVGNYDRAIDYYSEAIGTNTGPADRGIAFNERGKAYAKKGDNNQAIADFTEAVRLDPTPFHCFMRVALSEAVCGEPFYNLGVAYEVKGDNDPSVAVYNKAIQLNPNYARAFCNRGKVKLRINDTSGSEDIAKAKELDASICR